MQCLTQAALLEANEHDRRDRAAFWRNPRHDGLECLAATYFTHLFPLHTHDTYVVGFVNAGCNVYGQRGARIYSGPGDICLINPGEVHDGGALEGAFSYRMTYPSVALMKEIAEETTGRAQREPPYFSPPLVQDPDILDLFRIAHERMEANAEGLAADEYLVAAYGLMLLRHANLAAPSRLERAPSAMAKVRDYLESCFDQQVDLDALAKLAGLSRFQLLRAFRRETGMTPHVYLTDCRVRAARLRLARGQDVAAVALACGFSDQSHLTRVFKAASGITPGRFRAARNIMQDGASRAA
jgi:AraC-like DNA-binding protein